MTTATENAALAPRQREWLEEDVERGLTEMALCGGNRRRASKRLAERGYDFPPDTLYHWANVAHVNRYAVIAEERKKKIEESIVREMRENAVLAAEVERAGLEEELERVRRGDIKDASASARNAAVVKGINVQHLLTLTDRPNVIVEHRGADEMLSDIAKRLRFDVEASAEEITDAELVSESDEDASTLNRQG